MDNSALDGIPPRERKRQEVCRRWFPPNPQHDKLWQAIFELILTENSYVRDLQLVVEVCFSFLLGRAVAGTISDILLKNHAFTGRKGGQGHIR